MEMYFVTLPLGTFLDNHRILLRVTEFREIHLGKTLLICVYFKTIVGLFNYVELEKCLIHAHFVIKNKSSIKSM